MYTNEGALIQDIKREVLTELQRGGYTNAPSAIGHQYNMDSGAQWQRGGYDPGASNHMYQPIKESVKNEILAEAEAQQANRMAQVYGLDRTLSDRGLQQMIDSRYRTVDNIKGDVKKELQTLRKMETQRSADPYVRDIAGALAGEGQRQGIPLEQLIAGLDQKTNTGPGIKGKFSNMINSGQRKGFLFGVGSVLLFNLIWPMAQNNMRSIAVRSVESGMSMVDKAKNFVGGQNQNPNQNQQGPPAGFTNFDPNPPTQGYQPPDGDNVE